MRSYNYVCPLILSFVPFRLPQLLACHRHGDGALPYMARASSYFTSPSCTQWKTTRIRHVFLAPPGQPRIITLGNPLQSPSASRHLSTQPEEAVTHVEKDRTPWTPTQTRLPRDSPHVELVRGVVTPRPGDLANGKGVRFNSYLCPKLLRGQVCDSSSSGSSRRTLSPLRGTVSHSNVPSQSYHHRHLGTSTEGRPLAPQATR